MDTKVGVKENEEVAKVEPKAEPKEEEIKVETKAEVKPLKKEESPKS